VSRVEGVMPNLRGPGFRFQNLRSRVQDMGFEIHHPKIQGTGFKVQDLGYKILGPGSMVRGLRSSVHSILIQDSGSRV